MTDIEGSTRLWEDHPAEMAAALEQHDELVRAHIEAAGGRVFKTVGDAFCAAFDSVANAVAAALETQRALHRHTWPDPIVMRVRMGLHSGTAVQRDGDFFGPVVNRTARLEAIAHGGQVLLSEMTSQLAADLLPPHSWLDDLGHHQLKDLGRERVYQLQSDGLPTEFPALRSLDHSALSNNLPVVLTSFIGRTQEVEAVRGLLEGGDRLITLVGAGGAGKTRLALQVAADTLDATDHGAWFVDLAPLADPDLLVEVVAAAAGIRSGPSGVSWETLVGAFRDRRLLLVLDNCEHLIEACAVLSERLLQACPGIRLLATSREPLAIGGERIYRVPSLTIPAAEDAGCDAEAALKFEAVQLFLDRASSHDPGFRYDDDSAAHVVSVCAQLDGIPLAIELAAARLRSMSIADIERGLQDRFRLLTGGSRTSLPRQRTLRALIDWSYEALANRDSAVFARLSVFAGGCDLPEARAVCAGTDMEDFDVVDAVSSLVDKSLLQAEPAGSRVRYRLLETLRQYAAERLREQPDEGAATRRAHAETFLALAEDVGSADGPGASDWSTRMGIENDNLRTAMDWYIAEPAGCEGALRMGVALRDFWAQEGYFSEGIELLRTALARPEAAELGELRARALSALTELCVPRGEMLLALESVDEALAIAHSVGDRVLTTEMLDWSAWLSYRRGEFEAAIGLIERAVELATETGSDALIAMTRAHRGGIISATDPEAAAEDLAAALAHYRSVDNRERIVNTLNSLGLSALEHGDIETGRAHLEEAAAMAGELLPHQRMYTFHNLGVAAFLGGDPLQAIPHWRNSFEIATEMEAHQHLPYNLADAAMCAAAVGSFQPAAKIQGAADSLFEKMQEVPEPLEAGLRDRSVADLCAALGVTTYDAAYHAGRTLDVKGAIALARDELSRIVLSATSEG